MTKNKITDADLLIKDSWEKLCEAFDKYMVDRFGYDNPLKAHTHWEDMQRNQIEKEENRKSDSELYDKIIARSDHLNEKS